MSGAYIVSRDEKDPRDILILLKPGGEPPAEQLALALAVGNALTVLQVLFPIGDKRYDRYFDCVLSLSQLGLVGPNASPNAGNKALIELKNEVVAKHGATVKNRYIRSLGWSATVLAAPAVVLASVIILLGWPSGMVPCLAHAWCGCMVGVWLSFGYRKRDFGFDDLARPEEDRMEPTLRLAFAGLLTLMLVLSFALGIVEVRIGSVTSTSIIDNGWLAVLVGALLGISEMALPSRVASQAAAWLQSG